MFNWIKRKTLKHYKQFLKYSVFGILCFFIDYCISIFLKDYYHIHYLLASTIGYCVGIVINYLFSITWVFSKRNLKQYWHIELAIFVAIEIVALLLMNLIIFLSTDYLFITFYISKLLGNFVAFFWNYLIKHLFLFKTNPEKKQQYINDKKKLYDK